MSVNIDFLWTGEYNKADLIVSCSFAGSNRPRRKLGANPTQERCCKEGAPPFEKALLFQPLEYFREGWVCVLIAKSEYDCKMHGKISLRSQGIFFGESLSNCGQSLQVGTVVLFRSKTHVICLSVWTAPKLVDMNKKAPCVGCALTGLTKRKRRQSGF